MKKFDFQKSLENGTLFEDADAEIKRKQQKVQIMELLSALKYLFFILLFPFIFLFLVIAYLVHNTK